MFLALIKGLILKSPFYNKDAHRLSIIVDYAEAVRLFDKSTFQDTKTS